MAKQWKNNAVSSVCFIRCAVYITQFASLAHVIPFVSLADITILHSVGDTNSLMYCMLPPVQCLGTML